MRSIGPVLNDVIPGYPRLSCTSLFPIHQQSPVERRFTPHRLAVSPYPSHFVSPSSFTYSTSRMPPVESPTNIGDGLVRQTHRAQDALANLSRAPTHRGSQLPQPASRPVGGSPLCDQTQATAVAVHRADALLRCNRTAGRRQHSSLSAVALPSPPAAAAAAAAEAPAAVATASCALHRRLAHISRPG